MEVSGALLSAWSDPTVLLLLVMYPCLLFLGVFFLLALVQDHGSVTAAAAAVVRKLASFVVSYIYFARPLSVGAGVGATLVFASVVLKAASEVKGVRLPCDLSLPAAADRADKAAKPGE